MILPRRLGIWPRDNIGAGASRRDFRVRSGFTEPEAAGAAKGSAMAWHGKVVWAVSEDRR
jgi:hypothetical protein